MATSTTSTQFSINWADAGKGFLVAAITAGLTALLDVLTTTPIVFDFKRIGIVGLTAGIAYLVKNFFTPAQTVTKP